LCRLPEPLRMLRRILAFTVLLLSCCALLRAQPQASRQPVDPGRLDAVKEFQKQFKKYKEEAQQVEAVLTLKGNECPPAVEELLKLLKHPVAAVQQAALTVLSTYQEPATFQPYIDALPTSKDEDARATIIKVMAAAKIKAAVPALLKVAETTKSPVTKYEVARALAQVGDPSVATAIGTMLSDNDATVRMAAADCVGALKLSSLGRHLVPLINDPEWQVQTVAIASAGKVRPIEAIPPLIELMRKTGRLRTECADALYHITGYEFGTDVDSWTQNWARMKEMNWRPPTDEELAKKAESRKKSDVLYGKKGEHNTFAGIKTTSTRLVFIIDQSGSMDDRVVETDKFPGYTDFRKFTVVKKNLLDAIEGLTQDTSFNIIAFATELHPWKNQLVPGNIVNRDAAKAWVERLKPLGGSEDQEMAQVGLGSMGTLSEGKTNTLKALLVGAFGIDPEAPGKAVFTGVDKNALKNKLDTVYFLSDGRPSVGKLVDTNEILKEVKRINDMFHVVIHTIAIGEFEKEFLRTLATQNGGEFVDLGR